MAASGSDKKNVLLCVDNSAQAEWAFECKLVNSVNLFLSSFSYDIDKCAIDERFLHVITYKQYMHPYFKLV